MLYERNQADDGIYFVTLTSDWIGRSVEITVNYYLENINGNYDRSDIYSQTFITSTGLHKVTAKEIEGFTLNKKRVMKIQIMGMKPSTISITIVTATALTTIMLIRS